MAAGVSSGARVGRALCGAVVAAAVVLAAGANEARADSGTETQVHVSEGGQLIVQAPGGVSNTVTLAYSAPTNDVLVSDSAGVVDIAPDGSDEPHCRAFGATTVACEVSALVLVAEPPSIVVALSDQADSAIADPSLPATLPFAVSGGGGQDYEVGGPGNDFLYGGGGRDRLNGGAGDDVIAGEEGDDILRGEADNDLLGGNEGRDKQFGGTGHDWIWTADEERDPIINCGANRDQPAIFDRGLDVKPTSC
jgi:RTX calcium-binding nonapeptide repeat (4 copies)